MPFRPYRIVSCRLCTSASLPQMPGLCVQPVPCIVCSHWLQNIGRGVLMADLQSGAKQASFNFGYKYPVLNRASSPSEEISGGPARHGVFMGFLRECGVSTPNDP